MDKIIKDFGRSMHAFCNDIKSKRKFKRLAIFGAGHSAITLTANLKGLNPSITIDGNSKSEDVANKFDKAYTYSRYQDGP